MVSQVAKKSVQRLVRKLGYEVVKAQKSDEQLYAEYSPSELAQRPFLNVGAGKFFHRHWTNVDYQSDWYAEDQSAPFVHYDLMALEPLPFDDASARIVYTSHTVEHVPDEAGANLFQESFRVLQPGGILRVTCPDASVFLRTLELGARGFWHWRKTWFEGPLSTARSLDEVTIEDFVLREVATPRCRFYKDAVDPVRPETVREILAAKGPQELLTQLAGGLKFRPENAGDHINWWTEEKLMSMVRAAGFEKIYRSRARQSMAAPLLNPALFDTTMPAGSLFIEAVR